jgi:hypothetical protein
MITLRTFNGFTLNKGNMMANGLFNVSTDNDVSFWFDHEQRDELMNCSDEEFQEKCENLIAESLVD